MKKFVYIVLGIAYGLNALQQPEQATAGDDLWMIIFVHGTLGARGNASFSNLYRIMVDDVENSTYEKAVNIIRDNPYIYQNQPIQECGLIPVNCTNRQPGQAAALFAHLFDTLLKQTYPAIQDTRPYTYGWSGVLSETIRYKNAARFYNELLAEYQKLSINNPGKKVKIYIVGYSHGGTVALQLARVFEKEKIDQPLTIDTLVLLGTPIQNETDHLVLSPLFKKVYHIYSRGDKVQKMDFFSFKRFFSYRRFNDDSRFVTPEKVVQIELKLKPWRRDYKKNERARSINRSPGHIELWFFGWTQGMYRAEFPLNPLPTACLIPTIINATQSAMPHETDVVVELYPMSEKCFVRKRHYFKKIQAPGISYSTLTKLRETARAECPTTSFNRTDYLQHMKNAVNQAYGRVNHHHHQGVKCHCQT